MALNVMIVIWKQAQTRRDLLIHKSDTHTLLDIRTNEQKKDWFLKLNPNGMLTLEAV